MLHSFFLQYYDIRKKCIGSLCYDFSNLEKFLNEKPVRTALGVGDIEFVSCSPTVYQAMLMDWMRNLETGIPALLEDGIKMLVYAGEYDLICNWLGETTLLLDLGEVTLSKLKFIDKTVLNHFYEQVIQGGYMQCSGVVRMTLNHPPKSLFKLMVPKQDC